MTAETTHRATTVGLRLSIAGLILVTGLIHLVLSYEFLSLGLVGSGLPFLGMAAGYAVALIVVLVRGLTVPVLLGVAGYVTILIVAWLVAGARSDLAYADKAVEALLLALLLAPLLGRLRVSRS